MTAGQPALIVGIAGSMTAEPLERHLREALHVRGVENIHLMTGAFNQLSKACRSPEQFFGATPDVIILLWRLEDIFPGRMDDPAALLAGLAELAADIGALRQDFAGTIVVSLPPYPSDPSWDTRQPQEGVTWRMTHAKLFMAWAEMMQVIGRIGLFDLPGLLAKIGSDRAFDARKWYLYRQPWSEIAWGGIGRQLARLIGAERRPPKKCIVLDADNTLWGGIIGEDGIGGIALGEEFPGSAYRDFQKYLLHLQKRGILLAVASKNNFDDFDQAFRTHDAMILKPEHIAAFEIHWDSKVDSLRRIAQKLNIGLDAIVFIDDSAKEIAEIRERLPEVACLLVPDEITDLPGLLAATDLFDATDVTAEDRQRTAMILTERQREEMRSDLSEEEFKAALGLEMTVFRARPPHLARLTQLINKTNQFNLTTRRRDADAVKALSASPDHLLLGMALKDKYGDYGLVGVAVLERRGDTAIIDTLLMSCRVLGRDAETAFLAQIAAAAATWTVTGLEGKYLPTAKNGMTEHFYARHDFTAADDGAWRAALDAVPKSPAHVTVKLLL